MDSSCLSWRKHYTMCARNYFQRLIHIWTKYIHIIRLKRRRLLSVTISSSSFQFLLDGLLPSFESKNRRWLRTKLLMIVVMQMKVINVMNCYVKMMRLCNSGVHSSGDELIFYRLQYHTDLYVITIIDTNLMPHVIKLGDLQTLEWFKDHLLWGASAWLHTAINKVDTYNAMELEAKEGRYILGLRLNNIVYKIGNC